MEVYGFYESQRSEIQICTYHIDECAVQCPNHHRGKCAVQCSLTFVCPVTPVLHWKSLSLGNEERACPPFFLHV